MCHLLGERANHISKRVLGMPPMTACSIRTADAMFFWYQEVCKIYSRINASDYLSSTGKVALHKREMFDWPQLFFFRESSLALITSNLDDRNLAINWVPMNASYKPETKAITEIHENRRKTSPNG